MRSTVDLRNIGSVGVLEDILAVTGSNGMVVGVRGGFVVMGWLVSIWSVVNHNQVAQTF